MGSNPTPSAHGCPRSSASPPARRRSSACTGSPTTSSRTTSRRTCEPRLRLLRARPAPVRTLAAARRRAGLRRRAGAGPEVVAERTARPRSGRLSGQVGGERCGEGDPDRVGQERQTGGAVHHQLRRASSRVDASSARTSATAAAGDGEQPLEDVPATAAEVTRRGGVRRMRCRYPGRRRGIVRVCAGGRSPVPFSPRRSRACVGAGRTPTSAAARSARRRRPLPRPPGPRGARPRS